MNLFGLKMAVKNNIGNVLTHNPAIQITPYYFFISQFKVVLHYLWIFIWPFAISVEYDWKLAKSLFAADCIIPLMILMCIGAFIFVYSSAILLIRSALVFCGLPFALHRVRALCLLLNCLQIIKPI